MMSNLTRAPKKTRQHSQRGFTLIEVLVAIAVLGILTGLASITLGDLAPKFDLDNAARSTAMALTRAKVQAVTRGHGTATWIWGGKFWTFDTETWQMLSDGEFSTGLTLSGTNAYVFTPLGTASWGGTLTLSNSGNSRNIVVGLVGTVEVE